MIQRIVFRLRNSQLFKDSFWAVFGNGLGNVLLLVAGIFIARFLGKDIYGEYGMVKTTMFHMAYFSTFGLSYTTTKFIAEYKSKDETRLRSITESSIMLTFLCAIVISILLFCFSKQLAYFINAPQLKTAFRFLSVIIVFRAINTTGAGLLAGYKRFKELGINNIIAGLVMLFLSIPLTYFYGLFGSLSALAFSQFVLAILNLYVVRQLIRNLLNQGNESFYKRLLSFSVPVAIQEFSYTICNWGGNLLITKYASLGALGIFSASSQWFAIVLFLPSLLQNVILSYLSGFVGKEQSTNTIFKKMILINFICALIPFLVVLLLSSYIVSFYGPTFVEMKPVLCLLVFATIPKTLSNVYVANLLANNRNWLLSCLRVSRDVIQIIVLYSILNFLIGYNSPIYYSLNQVFVEFLFLVSLLLLNKKRNETL